MVAAVVVQQIADDGQVSLSLYFGQSCLIIAPFKSSHSRQGTATMTRKVFTSLVLVGFLTIAAHADDKSKLMARGQQVYTEYCKTCHQANGQGLGAVYPPLAKSDYLKSTPMPQIIKEVVNGKSGKIKVNGKEYNGVMAPLPKKYTDEDIASVITYVYNSFGNAGPTVTVADVKKHKKK